MCLCGIVLSANANTLCSQYDENVGSGESADDGAVYDSSTDVTLKESAIGADEESSG